MVDSKISGFFILAVRFELCFVVFWMLGKVEFERIKKENKSFSFSSFFQSVVIAVMVLDFISSFSQSYHIISGVGLTLFLMLYVFLLDLHISSYSSGLKALLSI